MPFMTSLSFSTNGKYLLVGTAGNAHYLMDAFDGYLLAKLEGFEGLERGKSGNSVGIVPGRGISGEEVCFTPDSKFVIGGDHTGKIHVWDLISNPPDVPTPDGQECRVIKPCYTTDGNSGPSRCVKFNPRFAMLATAGGELVLYFPQYQQGDVPDDFVQAFWLPDNAALQNDGDSKMENAEDARAKMDWK
jgi:COMPASS component SWD2